MLGAAGDPDQSHFWPRGLVYPRPVSVGSLSQHGLRSPLSGGRRPGETVPAHPSATLALVVVAGLVAIAAALRFYGIGHQGFWFDEANTAQLVRFSPGKMLGLIPQSESTPPLYYCVAWVWARVFGDREAGLRSLSAVAGVLVVPVAYAAGARLISRRAGIIAAALTACNPLLIWYSQEARSYSMLVLLTALSLLAFVCARETRRRRALLTAWVLASAPGAGHALLRDPRRRARGGVAADRCTDGAGRSRSAVAIVVACGLALIPLAISQNGTGHDSWIATASLGPAPAPDRAPVPHRYRHARSGGAARSRPRAGRGRRWRWSRSTVAPPSAARRRSPAGWPWPASSSAWCWSASASTTSSPAT